jgi:DNA-binding NtrC family response regulator
MTDSRRDEKMSREFLRPLNEILDFSERLMQDAQKSGHDPIIADIKRIHSSGQCLMEILDSILENKSSPEPTHAGDLPTERNLRHDLRMPLNAIIGYSEMLLEDAEESGREYLITSLKGLLSSAMIFSGTIDQVVSFRDAPASLEEKRTSPAGDENWPEEKDEFIGDDITPGSFLVVDDDETGRDLLSRLLARLGHTISTAENGRKALEILGTHTFDIVLLDMVMPEMDGLQVLGQIKRDGRLQKIPVIVISALEEMESVVHCLKMGAEDYILKPFNPIMLKARISTCLERMRLRKLSESLELRNMREGISFIAESRQMEDVLNTVSTVSRSPVNVLIQGDSGTGKEMIARMIHNGSDRSSGPFVAVNCASIPENLMESEFFGYEKGAFTGAVTSRGGRFEEASGGSLFLDEIGDMPLAIQPKFLRVLQEGEGTRLGSNRPVKYDFRIISATNNNIRDKVSEGLFREDLFYRIFSVEINVPPLKERHDDIVPMSISFMDSVCRRFKKTIAGFAPEVLAFFEGYPWPGNVRQLLHEVERMVALTPEGGWASLAYCSEELREWHELNPAAFRADAHSLSMPDKIRELEISCIKEALAETGGNKLQASKLLGITRQGLDKKIKRYSI